MAGGNISGNALLRRRTDRVQRILERLATTEKITLVCERAPDGKIRGTSCSWDGEKVILPDQLDEIRNLDAHLHVARKSGSLTKWNRLIQSTNHYRSDVSSYR